MVSVVYSQSDLLRKEVFLVETMDNASSSRESMAHLKAVYFLRPSADNVQKLRRHLAMPRFAEYHLCASSVTDLLWNFGALGLFHID
jgi:vacuolar protein sorting-associated protein 45